MKLTIIQFSDIHFKSDNDGILKKEDAIVKQCIQSITWQDVKSDIVLFIVTGDITFSGTKEQFYYAKNFFTSIQQRIEKEIDIKVIFISCPGNHDCDFKDDQEVRNILLDKAYNEPNTISESIINTVCEVQNNYFEFAQELTPLTPVKDHKLIKAYEITHGQYSICIASINTSWCSKLYENQGKLVYPNELISSLEANASINIALIHHPLNWYCQEVYHPFKEAIYNKFDILLSGHEHCGHLNQNQHDNLSLIHIESPALQPHDGSEESQFYITQIDFNDNIQKELIAYKYSFNKKNNQFEKENTINHTFTKNLSISQNALTEDFKNELRDAGGLFSHPQKEKIYIDDFYIFPEIEYTYDDKIEILSSEKILDLLERKPKIIIYGEEEQGKSTLLKRFFYTLHKQNKFPLYIKADDLSNFNKLGIENAIDKVIKKQYQCIESFKSSHTNRVVLLDDFDEIKHLKGRQNLFNYLNDNFNSIIIIADSSNELTELLDSTNSTLLKGYQTYRLRDFGHKLCFQLIKKWYSCGNHIEDPSALDSQVLSTETRINMILGSKLIPPRPLNLMLLLQTMGENNPHINDSSFAQYYNYLITQNLLDAKAKRNELTEIYNYIARLAWLFKSKNRKEISEQELITFNNEFCTNFTTVNYSQRIELLLNSRVLKERSGYFSFCYSYVFYFFIGKYLATNIENENIQEIIKKYCNNLHKTQDANSILFLSYHTNQSWIIKTILDALQSLFKTYKPITLNNTTKINQLIEQIPTLLIKKDTNVEDNQLANRAAQDQLEAKRVEIEENNTEDSSEEIQHGEYIQIAVDMNKLVKTSEILGRVIINYYGTLERPIKQTLITEIFSGSLRMMNMLFETILEDPLLFISEIKEQIKNIETLSDDKLEKKARNISFILLTIITSGILGRTASFVTSKELKEDILGVTLNNENKTHALSLVSMAYLFMLPNSLNMSKIKELAKQLKNDHFCFMILRIFAYYRLHMIRLEKKERQALCDVFNIEYQTQSSVLKLTDK